MEIKNARFVISSSHVKDAHRTDYPNMLLSDVPMWESRR